MPQLLETVVNLQKALTKLHDLEQRLSGVPPEMQELHDRYTADKKEIDRLQAIIDEAGVDRRSAEATSQDCASKLHHFQEQVNRVRTQREYSAILQEIDQVREQSRAAEEVALAAMETQEEAETEMAPLTEEFEAIDVEYQIELEKWEAAKPGVAEEAEALRARVAELRDAIPKPSLMLFERLRDFNDGSALASVGHMERSRAPNMWRCNACNYNVRPQIVVEIKNRGALVQCDSCKRLLYLEESVD